MTHNVAYYILELHFILADTAAFLTYSITLNFVISDFNQLCPVLCLLTLIFFFIFHYLALTRHPVLKISREQNTSLREKVVRKRNKTILLAYDNV